MPLESLLSTAGNPRSMSNTVIASNVSTIAELNAAIDNTDGEGAFEIDLKSAADIGLTTALEAINLKSGVTLDIEGDGAILDGENETTPTSYDARGLFVDSGDVTINNLTVQCNPMRSAETEGGGGEAPT
jgi:hypothetical protein